MAVTVEGERDMQDFVRSLFQGSPDLSVLTHAIVRKKYLAHLGQETLTKEEKEQLKQLVEEELVQMQVEDSASHRELSIESQTSIRPGGQKRCLCPTDTSGDEVRTRQKKQRTGKELEVSSDEQDSGIDSKKISVRSSPRSTGKLPGALDQGDSGAEDHTEGSGSDRQSTKKKSRGAVSRRAAQEHQRGRKRGRSGSESEEAKEGQGSDLEEELRGRKKTSEGQSSESDEEQELKDCKLQKKRPFSKQQKWAIRLDRGQNSKMLEGRRRKDSESEEENEPLRVGKAKRAVERSEDGKGAGGSQKAEIRARQRTQKVQEESNSSDESEEDAEENRMRKSVPNNKRGRKSEGSESTDNTEDSPTRKATPQAKTRRAAEEKWGQRLARNSEEREKSARRMGKGGMRKNVSRRELEEGQDGGVKRCHPKKQQGRLKPKRSRSSSDESERELDESRGLQSKKEEIRRSSNEGNESQDEEEEGRSKERKAWQAPVSSNESESEKSDTGVQRKTKTVKKRSKAVSGSDNESTKDRRAAVSQKESDSEMESEEDSGSAWEGKKQRGGHRKKATPKPKRKRNSKEVPENDSVEETGGSSSEENSHHSKQQHRGKDREHSGKREDHPSIQRLKRYIRECGVHRNYKKLLADCRSRKAQVEALKKELENIGLKGAPSLAKCRALKQKREEAAEVASLDLSNIITTEGRPRRRNVWSLYSKPQESPSSPEESPIRRPATDWSRLRGVISSDGESN